MKTQKLLSLVAVLLMSLSLFSCKDDEATPDYASIVSGVYVEEFNTALSIKVTKVGTGEIRLSNQSGSFLDENLVLKIVKVDRNRVTINNEVVDLTTYTLSDSDIVINYGVADDEEVMWLLIETDTDVFEGNKI